MASTPIAPSKAKPSQPDEIVELRPPPHFGFSGTRKYYRIEHADTIKTLRDVGYTVVEQAELNSGNTA